MNKKAIIFDMDGLLFDSEAFYRVGYKKVGKSLGVDITDELFMTLLGRGLDQIIQMLDERFEGKVDAKKIPLGVLDYMEKSIDNGKPPAIKKGAIELIKKSKENGYKIALGTSNTEKLANKILKSTDMLDVFDAKVYGDMVERRKPNPDIFLKACSLLEVEPSETYVLEDSEMGILASHNAGIDCISVPDIKYPDKKYIDLCLYVAKDLLEVKDYIFK